MLFHENKNKVNDCFEYINNSLKEKKVDNISLKDYEQYYRNTWIQYLENEIKNIEKFKRSNSYLENYNKHIKQILSSF